jgi:hypothetical protein
MSLRRARAFTLLEVMAVVLMLGLVFLVMGSVFGSIASTTTDASQTELTRRGLLLVDRVARDLEAAMLVEKPDELDPLAHPWLFFAESRRSADGADRLKFDARAAPSGAEHAGDLAVIAYWVEPGDADDLRLVRWSAAALPEGLDRSFPRSGDDGAQVLANGLARFGVRFVDEEGAVTPSWDSSTAQRSGQLPVAAEISLALLDPAAPEGERAFTRRVVLPLRPIDLEAALSGEDAGDDEEDEDDEDEDDCVTVGACYAQNAAALQSLFTQYGDPGSVQALLDANREQCVEEFEASTGFPIAEICP